MSKTEPAKEAKSKSRFDLPHVYVILFGLSAVAAVMTYFVPAGEYERVPGPEGRTTIDPDSYTQVEQSPVGLFDFMLVIPKGLIDAGTIVFFTFIIGGLFVVMRNTGIIELGVDKLTRRFSSRGILVIPVLMVVFAVIATLIGTQELSLVYVPVILPLMIALRFDSVVAAGIALCATTAGFATGVLNPINTGLGQKIAGIPVWSGVGLRLAAFVVFVTIAVVHVMRYARKVKKDPQSSLVYEDDLRKRERYQHAAVTTTARATTRQRFASVAALGFFVVLVYGVLVHGWFMVEMSGLFIFMGIGVGLIAGLRPSEICEGFNEGFRDVLVGAIIVGVARSVAVVLEDGRILDTIVYGLGQVAGEFPPVLSALGMFLIQMAMSFLVSSGSGQALVTMPIMAPLSDVIEVTRQTAVLAYQLGDGPGNIIFPTSGYFMATIVLAGVSYKKWIRFYFPLFLMWVLAAAVFLVIAQASQWTG
ncbi:MAG: YfcC family protein [Haloechinothrix sp.]